MTKKAVLVGINYPGTNAELRGCINDVWGTHKWLIERFGFCEEDILVMIDTDRRYLKPTGANIRQALNKMVSEACLGDILFFHYSGHGTRIPADTGEKDDTGYDECIVPCDMNLLTDDDFREIVNQVPEGVTLTMVSDSCHSGGLIDNEKEQIGESSKKGSHAGSKLRDMVSEGVQGAPETRAINLGSGSNKHTEGRKKDEVKSRALPIKTVLEILQKDSGRDDINTKNLHGFLFDMFGDDSSSKVKRFAQMFKNLGMLTSDTTTASISGSGGGLMGSVGSLTHKFMKNSLDGFVEHSSSTSPMKTKVPTNNPYVTMPNLGPKSSGVLVSGCQSSQTSADASPNGNPKQAFGAMSNSIKIILSQTKGPISNRELVTKARQLLREQGYSQRPGLYCGDARVDAPFIC